MTEPSIKTFPLSRQYTLLFLPTSPCVDSYPRISFLSICLSAAITYAGAGADFFVYYNTSTSPLYLSISLFLGLLASFTFTFILGIGLASAIPTVPSYSAAYETSQGALIVAPLLEQLNDGFARFLGVIIVLGLIANTVAPTYSSGIDFQILSDSFERVPRIFWNT
ncbi:MAG: hypothetical protein Q9214_003948, partial [Letrouitia sp. 1 TL-2023]